MSNEGGGGAAEPPRGPAELVLAATVARRFYIDNQSKIEIADQLGMSRFKVARLLDVARAQGLVRIEIAHPGTIDVDLSARLRERFRLNHAIVVDTHEDDSALLRRQLGQAAADLLSEIVTATDVLGLVWARAVSAMATHLRRLPSIPVVQLTGALARSTGGSSAIDDSSIDAVREVARVSGGPAYLFFAPFMVPDPATARAMRQQPDVSRAFDRIGSVTKAVSGIGRWAPGQSTLYDAATVPERELLTRQGVCADIGGVFLDADGRPLATRLNRRMVAIGTEQMRTIPELICIAYGAHKRPAVAAGLRSGIVKSIVTHADLAMALLDEDSERSPEP